MERKFELRERIDSSDPESRRITWRDKVSPEVTIYDEVDVLVASRLTRWSYQFPVRPGVVEVNGVPVFPDTPIW